MRHEYCEVIKSINCVLLTGLEYKELRTHEYFGNQQGCANLNDYLSSIDYL